MHMPSCSAVCLKHTHFLIDQYFFYSEVFYWYHDKNHYIPEKQCCSNSLKLQFFVLALQSLNFRRIDLICDTAQHRSFTFKCRFPPFLLLKTMSRVAEDVFRMISAKEIISVYHATSSRNTAAKVWLAVE